MFSLPETVPTAIRTRVEALYKTAMCRGVLPLSADISVRPEEIALVQKRDLGELVLRLRGSAPFLVSYDSAEEAEAVKAMVDALMARMALLDDATLTLPTGDTVRKRAITGIACDNLPERVVMAHGHDVVLVVTTSLGHVAFPCYCREDAEEIRDLLVSAWREPGHSIARGIKISETSLAHGSRRFILAD